MNKKQVYHKILDLSREIAREKKGALFVIGPEKKIKGTYDLHYSNVLESHMISEKGMAAVMKSLSTLDGATFVTDQGKILCFGARIRKSKTVLGFGTRHAAAAGITNEVQDATAVLVSEELGWIKVFQKGKIIMEMDSSKRPANIQSKIVSFITDNDTALLTTAGASAAIVGLTPVVIIAGTYLAVKTAAGMIRKNIVK